MQKQQEFSQKLGRQDWVNTGLNVLAESGVEAVRVEPLARLMNVTKGSFYWHFKDRQDLLDALLAEWISLETNRIIERVNALQENASTKLLRLLEMAIEDDGGVENAIRAWARTDTKVAAVLAQVDQRRLDYTQDLFLQIGFTPIEARVRARMAYYSLVGEFTIATRTNQAERLAEVRHQHGILTHQ
jgi:AcrR family transcriptional regulator